MTPLDEKIVAAVITLVRDNHGDMIDDRRPETMHFAMVIAHKGDYCVDYFLVKRSHFFARSNWLTITIQGLKHCRCTTRRCMGSP